MLSNSGFVILARNKFSNIGDIAREAMELIDKIVAKKEIKAVGGHEIVITYTNGKFFVDVYDLKTEECHIAAYNEDKKELKNLLSTLL